jgi:peptidoglycan/xylan/chitin deacetylase (PgdA/CDA1 family)
VSDVTATVTLSLEIELGWGYHDLRRFGKLGPDREPTTRTLGRLLDLCDELEIPFTFDVVGALAHDEVTEVREGPHPDGWFETVADVGPSRPALFCAPDLVGDVRRAAVPHEICTHTYSHVLCGDVPDHVVAWELETANEVLGRFLDDPPVSFVPPRHSPPPKRVLRENGVDIVRTIGSDPAPTKLHKLNDLLFDPPDPMAPAVVDGVVETYCTPYTTLTSSMLPSGQKPPLKMFGPIPRRVRQRLHRRYLDRAVEKAVARDSYTHLWGHLHELGNDAQWRPIRSFLESLAARRDRGEVEVLTMAGLRDHVGEHRPDRRRRTTGVMSGRPT